ncbi:MAG: glycogen synthase GlgA [Nitrospinae bacterium]|nr:glycogen synthase GlgA [Nitrospinota bacterium]
MKKKSGPPKGPLTIVFVVSEAVPFIKTGGLGDVGGALPAALAEEGAKVHVFVPRYKGIGAAIPKGARPEAKVAVPMSTRLPEGEIYTLKKDGVDFHFVGNENYFGRDHLYNTPEGDYLDNLERFAFFCRAALEGVKALGIKPDIVHANDWQTALVPVYLKTIYMDDPVLGGVPGVYTIHNLGYQGLFNPRDWRHTGLDFRHYRNGEMEFYGGINLMKGGLVFADLITTVSPTYASEIKTREHGWGLDGVLRKRADALCGVLNGIDTKVWNPAGDKLIPANYTPAGLAGKKVCKEKLFEELGQPPGNDPLIGVVSRLVEQKGMDLFAEVIDSLLDDGMRVAMLGSGSPAFEELFRELAARRPDRASVRIGYDEGLAHRIEAGSDIFLMPSRYEPCGLNQMYSLRYGAAPVVRATGGLNDTVSDYDPVTGAGNGFKFHEPSAHALYWKTSEAAAILRGKPDDWYRMVKRAMKEDYSWSKSARTYLGVYKKLAWGKI